MNGRRLRSIRQPRRHTRSFSSRRSIPWPSPGRSWRRLKSSMAVENHKDLQAARHNSNSSRSLMVPFIGICIDMGNSIRPPGNANGDSGVVSSTCFHDPFQRAWASKSRASMASCCPRCRSGLVFSTWRATAATVRHARPEIRLNLEMITRDPLKIPCLTPRYWATLDHIPGRPLGGHARTGSEARRARSHCRALGHLRRTNRFSNAKSENVRRSLRYAKGRLEAGGTPG